MTAIRHFANEDPEHMGSLAHHVIEVMLADGHSSDEEMELAWAMVKVIERKEDARRDGS